MIFIDNFAICIDWIITFVLFSPSFLAFWTEMIFPPSSVHTALTSLPSGVVSSKGSPS